MRKRGRLTELRFCQRRGIGPAALAPPPLHLGFVISMANQIRREDRPGLYCVELRTENWDQLVEWYREALGLRVLVRVIDDGYALLEAGETRLALLARESTREVSNRISLAFEVSDVSKICARLEAKGSPVSRPRRDQEGLCEANTADPDGNRIRLFSWPNQ
jgi:predicted enzyme related to lactoylglutathione lyase